MPLLHLTAITFYTTKRIYTCHTHQKLWRDFTFMSAWGIDGHMKGICRAVESHHFGWLLRSSLIKLRLHVCIHLFHQWNIDSQLLALKCACRNVFVHYTSIYVHCPFVSWSISHPLTHSPSLCFLFCFFFFIISFILFCCALFQFVLLSFLVGLLRSTYCWSLIMAFAVIIIHLGVNVLE